MEKEDKIGLILGYVGILILTLIGIVSAETIFAGECNSIEFPNPDPVEWKVEGNSSNMDGFFFTKNKTNITYCFHYLFKPDNFTLTFFNYQSLEISSKGISGVSSGGGGSLLCFYNKSFDWNCSEWSECNGTQTRKCKEFNNCGNVYGKPIEFRECVKEVNKTISLPEPPQPPKISWFKRFLAWIKRILKFFKLRNNH